MFGREKKQNNEKNSSSETQSAKGAIDNEIVYEAVLLLVAGLLASSLEPGAKKPEQPQEVVEGFTQVHALLQKWFGASMQKEKVMELIGGMFPDAGFLGYPKERSSISST